MSCIKICLATMICKIQAQEKNYSKVRSNQPKQKSQKDPLTTAFALQPMKVLLQINPKEVQL